MRGAGRIARAAVAAGISLSLATVPIAGAVAADLGVGEYQSPILLGDDSREADGQTRLFVTTATPVVAGEGSGCDQIRVSVPVAIHFAANSEGYLFGPSDNQVTIRNLGDTGSVHVSRITATPTADVTFKSEVNVKQDTDSVELTMSPRAGQIVSDSFVGQGDEGAIINLASYTGNGASPVAKGDWDIPAAGGAIALNGLGGKISSYSTIEATEDFEFGSINWTLRAGTRSEADERDSQVRIRFNANGGILVDGQTLDDVFLDVLDVTALPERVAIEDALDQEIPGATGIIEAARVQSRGIVWEQFAGWVADPVGEGDDIETLADLGKTAEELAGTTVTLYAYYG